MTEKQPLGGWNIWSQHVLAELERLNIELLASRQEMRRLEDKINEHFVKSEGRYQALNIKTGVIGFIGGTISTITAIIAKFFELF